MPHALPHRRPQPHRLRTPAPALAQALIIRVGSPLQLIIEHARQCLFIPYGRLIALPTVLLSACRPLRCRRRCRREFAPTWWARRVLCSVARASGMTQHMHPMCCACSCTHTPCAQDGLESVYSQVPPPYIGAKGRTHQRCVIGLGTGGREHLSRACTPRLWPFPGPLFPNIHFL